MGAKILQFPKRKVERPVNPLALSKHEIIGMASVLLLALFIAVIGEV
jgi:hypothetical protein